MVFVKALDIPPIAERIYIDKKIAIQRANLINADFNRSISVFAEIKPLQSLYKPILDSLTGIFQQKGNFKLAKNGGVVFNDDGIISFVDDLSSKDIRSSIAIAQALNEIATNAPAVGQPRANYARELARLFGQEDVPELTTEQIIKAVEALGGFEPDPVEEDDEFEEEEEEVEELEGTTEPARTEGFTTPLAGTPLVGTPRSSAIVLPKAKTASDLSADDAKAFARQAQEIRDTLVAGKYQQYKKLKLKSRDREGKRDYFSALVELLRDVVQNKTLRGEFNKLLKEDEPGKLPDYKLKALQEVGFLGSRGEGIMRRPPLKGKGVQSCPTPIISSKGAEKRFKVLLGEMKAGNNSKILKKELKGLGDALYGINKLSKESNLKIQKL